MRKTIIIGAAVLAAAIPAAAGAAAAADILPRRPAPQASYHCAADVARADAEAVLVGQGKTWTLYEGRKQFAVLSVTVPGWTRHAVFCNAAAPSGIR